MRPFLGDDVVCNVNEVELATRNSHQILHLNIRFCLHRPPFPLEKKGQKGN